jgi:predicted DNA-binding transcriptional regulator AlpA
MATPHENNPLTLRAKDLAQRLGVSERHVHRLAKHDNPAERLPEAIKIGRATVWRYADIVAWLDAKAVHESA